MIFVFLCIVFFVLGVLLGIPSADFAIKKGVVVTASAFVPFLILNFWANSHPLVSDIRYFFFAMAWGLACYWAYKESKAKSL